MGTHSHHTRFQIPPCFPPHTHTHSHTPHPPHTLTHSSRTLRLTMKIIFFSACTTMLALYVDAASDGTWKCEAFSHRNPLSQGFCGKCGQARPGPLEDNPFALYLKNI